MFARDKRIGPYTYVYLVENVREEGRTKQRIIANLGRKEVVVARGDLDRLARSVVRLAQRSMVLSLVEGEAPPNARCQRIGPALLFERLWHHGPCGSTRSEHFAPTSHTGACARPTRTRNKPWVTLVLARYSSARSCLRCPAGQSITGMSWALAKPRLR